VVASIAQRMRFLKNARIVHAIVKYKHSDFHALIKRPRR
jgi:hypothetical protein